MQPQRHGEAQSFAEMIRKLRRRLNVQRQKKSFVILVGSCCAAICLAAQVRINYHDQDFTLSGFDTFSATLEDQGVAFKGNGNPLHIEIESSGTKITGAGAEGNAMRGADRAYFLKDSTISGHASLTIDGAAAQAYAAKQKRPSQASAPVTTTTIQSDTIKYAGTAQDGRTDFPSNVVIDSLSKGTTANKDGSSTSSTRTLHLTGTSGFVTVTLNSASNNALQTGEISGPVNYSGKGESTSSKDNKMETTTFSGRADNLKFDFAKEPRTLTLSGNVTLHSEGTAASGDISADTVVVTLDANLKPTRVDISGSPAKTTLRQGAGT